MHSYLTARENDDDNKKHRTLHSPDVKVRLERLLLGLVPAPDVVAAPLVGHQLSVGLHHDRVEVLDPVNLHEGETRERERVREADIIEKVFLMLLPPVPLPFVRKKTV